MTHVHVRSSSIHSAGYDQETRKAELTFKAKDGAAGDTYEYEDVSPDSMLSLLFSPSIGSHFAKHFKARHTLCTKLKKEDPS